jgi:hypothetical protein
VMAGDTTSPPVPTATTATNFGTGGEGPFAKTESVVVDRDAHHNHIPIYSFFRFLENLMTHST